MTQKTPAEIEIEKLEKEIEEIYRLYGYDLEVLSCNNRLREFQDKLLELKAKLSGLKQGIELGRKESEEDFKENLLMRKTNHQLGCMLECYANVIENRLGFSIEAIKLTEIASKLK